MSTATRTVTVIANNDDRNHQRPFTTEDTASLVGQKPQLVGPGGIRDDPRGRVIVIAAENVGTDTRLTLTANLYVRLEGFEDEDRVSLGYFYDGPGAVRLVEIAPDPATNPPAVPAAITVEQRQTRWTPTREALPPEDARVVVITEGGDERPLVYSRNMWWLPDRSMYCYFRPLFWRLDG